MFATIANWVQPLPRPTSVWNRNSFAFPTVNLLSIFPVAPTFRFEWAALPPKLGPTVERTRAVEASEILTSLVNPHEILYRDHGGLAR